MKKILPILASIACIAVSNAESISLPKANTTGGKPLMEVIASRASNRDFKHDAKLTQQELADLLWCANGFNRPDKRTAPSAVNAQAIDIYVFDAEAVWMYQPKTQSLDLIAKGDHREITGMQPFVKNAAVNLVYVYDKTRWPMKGNSDGKWATADAAFCAENVYLFCASQGLKTVVRGGFKETELRKLLNLPDTSVIALTQSIGR